jgi:MFS superfamily sulfate permease-like transporter
MISEPCIGLTTMSFSGRPPSTVTVYTLRPVTRADIPALCADLAERLRSRDPGVVICDVVGVQEPDVVTVEALARLRLTARRHGWVLHVYGADQHVLSLVRFLGLGDALAQAGGQAEEREQVGGVEEVVDRRDASA